MNNSIFLDYYKDVVKEYHDKCAFADMKREVSFAELDMEANKVAYQILRMGVHKKPILLFMEKSVSLVSLMIGTAMSGNFYSPLDTKMPEDRINKIINTLNPALVITDLTHYNQVSSMFNADNVLIFDEIMQIGEYDIQLVKEATDKIIDTDILYILFTSGSTGDPKGVIINHRAVVDFVKWITDCYNFDESTTFANQAQLYFDLSIQDIYVPLYTGATTVLISNRLYTSPVRVWKIILERNVNTLVWIPSMISLFANLDILNNVPEASLKTVLFCGEVMPMKQLNYWIHKYPMVTFGNLYGPTECTEACTYYTIDREFSDEDVLPMGIPCENSDAFIVDENGNVVVEENIIGELYVRGTCLSDGYYGNLEKTAEVFVQNPINDKYRELVYKTGDLVYYNERNELVYSSRKDFQIKIRGYRVELGEIEAAASAIESIEYSCALFDEQNEKIILVYTGNITIEQLKEHMAGKLQEYMIPKEFYQRQEMLFNINGKIDRKELTKMYIIEN